MFFVLDLLLGWQYYSARSEIHGYVESYADLLANTRTLLAQHNFSLAAEVPTKHPDMPSLSARLSTLSGKQIRRVAFASRGEVGGAQGGRTVVGTVRQIAAGTWVISYANPVSFDPKHPEQLLSQVVNGDDYEFDKGMGERDALVFDQLYDGKYPIFDACVLVDVGGGRMTGYQQTMLTDLRAAGNPKPIISALDALNSLANSVDKSSQPQDNTIVQIDLGYQSNVSNSPATHGGDNQYWFPVWRIVTSEGVFYVNAFTGELNT
jgi:hypothetical protein